MNPLLIDVSRLVARQWRHRLPTGIDRVALAYVRHFGPRARAVVTLGSQAAVLGASESQRLFGWLLAQADDRASTLGLLPGLFNAPMNPPHPGSWFLNTGHTGLHRPGYAAMLARLGVRPLYLVHDLIPISHPQYCRAPERLRHVARMRTALQTGSAIVCNSTATFDGLARFARQQSLPLPPAVVAPLAADTPRLADFAAGLPAAPIAVPYFLMIGTIEPRKNHLLMLQVWQRLVERFGARAPKLVLIGQPGWECEHVLRLLERAPELRLHVLQPGRCDDRQLQAWILHARALLFPSFAEGFGLPVLEALRLQVPVIASDLPVFREFAGDLPDYVDPLDARGWQAAIEDYADEGHRRRARKREALRGFAGPDWPRHFAAVEDLMRRIDATASRVGATGRDARSDAPSATPSEMLDD